MALLANIKEAVSVIRKLDNLDLYRLLLESEREALELMEQLRDKDKTIAELKKTLELKEKLHYFAPVYFTVDKDGFYLAAFYYTKFHDSGISRKDDPVLPEGVDYHLPVIVTSEKIRIIAKHPEPFHQLSDVMVDNELHFSIDT